MAPRRESLEQRRARHARIVKRYTDGDPIEEIASDEDVDRKTVRNVARGAGLPLRNPRRSERNARIVSGYQEGRRVKELAESEGCSSSYVSHLLSEAGVPRRPDRRLYPIDETAFDDPDPTGWWLIGLLAADGCVNERRHMISLSQRGEDKDVLEAFLRYVGSGGRPLTELRFRGGGGWHRPDGRYFEARVFSKRLCEAVGRHGVVPRKSRTLKLSDEAASNAEVWLGLLDGDGSLGVAMQRGRPRIDFFGTRAVMEQCSGFWGSKLTLTTGRNPAVSSHVGGLWKVSVHGANAARAARLMLSTSPVSMKRKRRSLEAIARADRPTSVED